jgi:hypothetical protein
VNLRKVIAMFAVGLLGLSACSNTPTERAGAGGQAAAGPSSGGTGASAGQGGGGSAGQGGMIEAGPVEVAVAPEAPTDLVLEIVDSTSIKLTWVDNSGGAAAFEVRWSTENSVPGPANAPVAAGVTTYTATNLTTNQAYYFWVRAVKNGLSSADVTGVKMPVTVPLKPGSFRAAPGAGGTVTLSWSPVVGEAGYNVYWAIYSGGDAGIPAKPATPNKQLATGTTTYLVTGLDPCTTYFFWVEAFNVIAAGEASRTSAKPEVVPASPTNLVVQVVGTTATLTWTDNATNESDYTVYLASGTGATKPVAGTSAGAKAGGDGGTASYVINGLTAGLAYTVWVEAKNCIGASDALSGAANTIALPPAPTTFTATVTGNASDVLHLTWVNVATAGDGGSTVDAKGIRIYYSTSDTPPKTPNVDNLPVTATSADISGLTPLTTYTFWIVAFNDSGESNPPLKGKGAIGAAPATPTGLVVDSTSSKFRMTLIWDPPTPGGAGPTATQNWKIEWTINGLPSNAAPVVLGVGTTSYALTELNVDSAYVYSLKASNVVGDSAAKTSAPARSFQIPGHSGNAIKDAWIEPNGYLHFGWYAGTGDAVGAATYTAYYNITPTRFATGYATQAPPKAEYNWARDGFLATSPRYFWGGGTAADGTLLWPATMFPGPDMTGAIAFSGQTTTSVTLTWPPVTGAKAYRVRWSESATKPTDNPHAVLVTTGVTYTVTGLFSGTSYNFWVESTGAAIAGGVESPAGLPGAVALAGTAKTAGASCVSIPTVGLAASHNTTFGAAPFWPDDKRAFDGNLTTQWGYNDGQFTQAITAGKIDQFGTPTNPPWVAVDLGATPPVVSCAWITWTGAFTSVYQLQGSNDQNGWTTLLDVCKTGGGCAAPTTTVADTTVRFLFANNTPYRYIRLLIPSPNTSDYANAIVWGVKVWDVALGRQVP